MFTSAAGLPAGVVAGTLACVSGTAQEFVPRTDLSSPPQTEISNVTVFSAISTGNTLLAPTVLAAADTPAGGSLDVLEH